MFDVTITKIILHPFTYKKIHKTFNSREDVDDFIKAYISTLEDVYSIDLQHRYELAVNRFKKGQLSIPYFFSHPAKGVLVRNVIEVKSYDY